MKRLVFLLAACPVLALAQAYPSKPIRIVTQFAPGSSGDTSLRIIGPAMSQDLGQPVIVDNRAGGGGVVAAELVIRAAPDGYTLLNGTSASHIIRPFLSKDSTFDPLKDLTPITTLYTSITLLVANPSAPFNNAREMIEYAKKNPGKLSYGTSGIGTDHHLSGEEINILTGANLVHVPYKATAQALLDCVSGQIPMTFAIVSAVSPFIKSGKIKVIAVNRSKRTPLFPDAASLEEIIPKYQTPPSWTAIFGPAGVPQPIVSRLHAAIVKALHNPDAQSRWDANGSEVLGQTPEEFAALLKSETALVARIVKAAGVKPE